MSLFCRLSGKHYWCTPHRSEGDRLVQVCYECGAERSARELHEDGLVDPRPQTVKPAYAETRRRAVPRIINRPVMSSSQAEERPALAQPLPRLVVVK